MNYIENKIEEEGNVVKVSVVPEKKSYLNRYTFTVGLFVLGFVLILTGLAHGTGSFLALTSVFMAKKFHELEMKSWK